MKCSFVFGPNAGQTFHAPRDQFIDILIRAGVIELIEADKPRPPVAANAESASIANHTLPVWSVIQTRLSGDYAIQCDFLRGTYYFNGPVDAAKSFKVGPHTVPTEIWEQYFRLKNQPSEEVQREAAAERQLHAQEDLMNRGGATQPGKTI